MNHDLDKIIGWLSISGKNKMHWFKPDPNSAVHRITACGKKFYVRSIEVPKTDVYCELCYKFYKNQ